MEGREREKEGGREKEKDIGTDVEGEKERDRECCAVMHIKDLFEYLLVPPLVR